MINLRTTLTIGLVVLWGLSAFAQRRPKDKILDKKVFVVTMEEQTDKKKKVMNSFEEELSFRSNKMTPTHMRSPDVWGFQMGEYVISDKKEMVGEEIYHFEAINKNPKGMSLKWEGRVFGGQIEGTAIVSKKGKVKEKYSFSGALKKKRK